MFAQYMLEPTVMTNKLHVWLYVELHTEKV